MTLKLSKRLLALLPVAALFSLPTTVAGAQETTVGAQETTVSGKWSPPTTLGSCPGTGAPYVVFPQDKPTHATGPGAIVWSASSPCPGGAGAQVAALSREDTPSPPTSPRTTAGHAIALNGPLAAAAGPHGRVMIAGASTAQSPGAGSSGVGGSDAGGSDAAPTTLASSAAAPAGGLLLTEGTAGGPFAAPLTLGGPAGTFAFTTAYLGDVALVSPLEPQPAGNRGTGSPGSPGGIQLRVQRYYATRFSAPTQVSSSGAASIEALTVALDFRTDRLVVWSQRGSLYARELPARDAPDPVQRLGPSPPPGARIAAVASDDNRAIVAWTYRHAGQTNVYVSRSKTGERFGAPQLLESFPDPPDLPDYVDSPRIVRLASESVMIAWTGAVGGHWAIRTAGIDFNGVRAADTISPAGKDALLAGFAPGPDDEVFALWTEPQEAAGRLDLDSQAIFAARGFDSYPGKTAFAPGEQVAPPGPNTDATIALDPDSDRAVAAWRTGTGLLAYATRASGGP